MRLRLLVLLCVLAAGPALAQNSIQVLETNPAGVSSGEVAPEATLPEIAPPPQPCGTQPLTIARMQWPSAALLAEIHSRLLSTHFGCDVRVQDGDMAATSSSMGTIGQPAVAPELWISRVAEIWNAAIKAQKVRQAGTAYADAQFEGWFVPDYVAAQWPDITSIEGLKAHAADFAVGGQPRGRFVSCPIDWGCAVINRNMLRANGLDGLFDIVEPANRFELDTLIAEAVSRKEPILFYYWQPNAVLSQFAFTPIALAAYNKDAYLCMGRLTCSATSPSGFAPDPVVIALAEWVYLDAPQVAAYFGRARMPFAEMNAMLQALNEPGATVESVADSFIAGRAEVWRPWLGNPIVAAPAQ